MHRKSSVADTGVPSWPPLFWTKLRPEGPKKIFLRAAPLLISGSGWPPPPTPSRLFEGLDPALEFLFFSQPKVRLLASFQVLVQKEMMDITPLSESPYPFLHLKPEKIRRTPLGQIVGETPGFLPTFSTDEPNVITRWGWGVFKQLRA